ncbi:uncharacterized protein G2W53_029090 [Senna tora]|uniref:Uncharacterized protein n=1 Tax=Senna tora TaxID=362788 RepID=A0A834WDE2_9FABA|nr:uncharacterized protein G2W53_029090 [Senna tora]
MRTNFDTAQPKSVDAGPSEAHSGETEQEGRKGKRARKPPVWANGTRFAKIDEAMRLLREEASEFKHSSLAVQAVTDQRLSHMESTMKNVEAILQRLEISHSSGSSGSSGSAGAGSQHSLVLHSGH